jgi:hypothetical protein
MKQVSYWGPTGIKRHHRKSGRHGELAPAVCSLLLNIHFNSYSTQNIQMTLSQYLIKHRAMETYGGVEAELNGFLASALDEAD